jgi:hypothetical protein
VRGLALIVAVTALLGLALPGDAQARSRKQCTPRGAVTVLRTTAAIRISKKGDFLYGCDRRTKRIMRLGPTGVDFPGKTISNLNVRNYFVAYTLSGTAPSSEGPVSDTYVRWVDLRHGKRLRPSTGCARRYEVSDGNHVHRVLLSSTGALAWVCSDVAASEVHKVDRFGPALLDTFVGPQWAMELDLGESLGVTVYWKSLDGLHSSRLVGPARLP